jgi:hypothetical protein
MECLNRHLLSRLIDSFFGSSTLLERLYRSDILNDIVMRCFILESIIR